METGGRRSVRRRIRPLGAGHGDGWGWAASWHRPVLADGPPLLPGLRVESVTVVHGRHELRAHRVLGAPPGTRIAQTGWATGPEEPLRSDLHGLHGWDGPSPHLVRAPQGTAWTPWALVPRLTGRCEGTSVHVALASLTGEPDPVPLAEAVEEVLVDQGVVEVVWAGGTARTRIVFEPAEVRHTRR